MDNTTNYSLGKTLRVKTYTNGVQNEGYKNYSLLNGFDRFSSISEEQLQAMRKTEYMERMNAFCDYVESLHPGLVVDRAKAYVLTSSVTQ